MQFEQNPYRLHIWFYIIEFAFITVFFSNSPFKIKFYCFNNWLYKSNYLYRLRIKNLFQRVPRYLLSYNIVDFWQKFLPMVTHGYIDRICAQEFQYDYFHPVCDIFYWHIHYLQYVFSMYFPVYKFSLKLFNYFINICFTGF